MALDPIELLAAADALRPLVMESWHPKIDALKAAIQAGDLKEARETADALVAADVDWDHGRAFREGFDGQSAIDVARDDHEEARARFLDALARVTALLR